MLPAYISARLLEKQRAADESEFARQLPLYIGDDGYQPGPGQQTVDGNAGEPSTALPDWMTSY